MSLIFRVEKNFITKVRLTAILSLDRTLVYSHVHIPIFFFNWGRK